MQFARVRAAGGGRDFAARLDSRSSHWTMLGALGLEAEDTAELIAVAPEVSPRMAAAAAAPTIEVRDEDLASPVLRPGKILAIGLNYADHIAETGSTTPKVPLVFAKYPSSLTGPVDPVLINDTLTREGDYESELAVIIGRSAKNVPAARALSIVFGYAVANDVSARDWQRSDPQFSRSKSFDTFCPIGPWITTADQVPDPQNLHISATVNGELRQDSSTRHMIFPVTELIAYLSRTMTLYPGDVILTGTPHGVGVGRRPPTFLVPGDRVRCEIDGLGAISNPIVGVLDDALL